MVVVAVVLVLVEMKGGVLITGDGVFCGVGSGVR